MTTTTFGALPIGATFDDLAWGLLGRGETKVSATSAQGADGKVGTVPADREVFATHDPKCSTCAYRVNERRAGSVTVTLAMVCLHPQVGRADCQQVRLSGPCGEQALLWRKHTEAPTPPTCTHGKGFNCRTCWPAR